MTITAHEFAIKLLSLPAVSNLPIRFSADGADMAGIGVMELQFESFNIEEEYVEVELSMFQPHEEYIDYLKEKARELYFDYASKIEATWCLTEGCFWLEVILEGGTELLFKSRPAPGLQALLFATDQGATVFTIPMEKMP